MLILWFLSICIDISREGGIDFPGCQQKRSVFTKAVLPSAMLWSGDQTYRFFGDVEKTITCCTRVLVSIHCNWYSPPATLNCKILLDLRLLCPVSSPWPSWAECRVGAAGRRSPALWPVFLLWQRDCALRAGWLGVKRVESSPYSSPLGLQHPCHTAKRQSRWFLPPQRCTLEHAARLGQNWLCSGANARESGSAQLGKYARSLRNNKQ